jgi:hypothetical protein
MDEHDIDTLQRLVKEMGPHAFITWQDPNLGARRVLSVADHEDEPSRVAYLADRGYVALYNASRDSFVRHHVEPIRWDDVAPFDDDSDEEE